MGDLLLMRQLLKHDLVVALVPEAVLQVILPDLAMLRLAAYEESGKTLRYILFVWKSNFGCHSQQQSGKFSNRPTADELMALCTDVPQNEWRFQTFPNCQTPGIIAWI